MLSSPTARMRQNVLSICLNRITSTVSMQLRRTTSVAEAVTEAVPNRRRTAMSREIKDVMVRLKANKWLLLLLVMLFAACDSTVFHRYASFESRIWNRADTLLYRFGKVPSMRNGHIHSICIEARTTAGYKYRNMVVRVEAFASGDTLPQAVDTLLCEVYDSNGRRKGSTAGLLYQVESEVKPLPELVGDTLTFKVSHIMEEDALDGIADVGLKLMRRKE